MSIIQAIILGIVQGITEFLPISSSAHLVLVPFFLNWDIPAQYVFPFDVLVQLGTLVAVIIYFWKDLLSIVLGFFKAAIRRDWQAAPFRTGIYLIIATIPAGLIGFGLNELVEKAFNHPGVTGIFLIVTAALLFLSERFGKRTRTMNDINWKDAVIVGFAQALAIFPGISRSGATISGALYRDLNREESARFSFLLSIPIFIAAGIFSLIDLIQTADISNFLPVLFIGFLVSAIVGYLAIYWLLRYLKKNPLSVFSIYCLVVGIVAILVFYV